MTEPEATFIFFRSRPDSHEARVALTSSMQSFDSMLLLIALERYPHALTTCASAIESTIKSSTLGAKLNTNFGNAVKSVRDRFAESKAFPEANLDKNFIDTRNRIVHEGFSPRDEREAAGQLIEYGVPFLAACFEQLYTFNLWDALLQDYVQQWRIGSNVFHLARAIAGLDTTYCLKSLGHLIRWSLKDSFSANWEIDAHLWTAFAQKEKQRQSLERLFETFAVFDCPLCSDPESAVCELDDDALQSKSITPVRMGCVNCGFVVQKTQPFLAAALLKKSIAHKEHEILKEYGLSD